VGQFPEEERIWLANNTFDPRLSGWGLQLFLIYWKAKIQRIFKIYKGKI
jgi:hypothetical protein